VIKVVKDHMYIVMMKLMKIQLIISQLLNLIFHQYLKNNKKNLHRIKIQFKKAFKKLKIKKFQDILLNILPLRRPKKQISNSIKFT